MSTATAPAAAPASPLRFTAGARERSDGVFYDESAALSASARVMSEAPVPPGNWLSHIDVLVDVTGDNPATAANVALTADAPWTLFSEVAFLDAAGNTVHALSGYNWYLQNLLGGFAFQSDPVTSPYYSALSTGTGANGGSGQFLLRIPVEIINRDAIGAYPNGASNAVTRIRFTLAPAASVYSTPPSAGATVRVRCISMGYVLPAASSPTNRPYAPEPPGAGTFQQWSQMSYDLTAGRRTIPHARKGQTYRTLIVVTRDNSGVRSNGIVNEFRFSVDDVATMRGPWAYVRHLTHQRQLIATANLPVGVAQISYAHEWDGKVGGELRDQWVPTQPGSKVDFELDVQATGTLTVLTNEIVPVPGSGVLRV